MHELEMDAAALSDADLIGELEALPEIMREIEETIEEEAAGGHNPAPYRENLRKIEATVEAYAAEARKRGLR